MEILPQCQLQKFPAPTFRVVRVFRGCKSELRLDKSFGQMQFRGMKRALKTLFCIAAIPFLFAGCATNQPTVKAPSNQDVEWANNAIALDKQLKRDLRDADSMIRSNQLREAEILLTRVVQTDGDNLHGWQSLITVHCGLAGKAIDAENWLEAGHHLDRANLALDKVKSLAITPGSQITPETVVKLENQVSEIKTNVQSSIDDYCNDQLEEADDWAYKAIDHFSHRVLPNNRDEIVSALQCLKPVIALKSWTSDSVRMEQTRLYLKCKKAVNSEEWAGLLARAGLGDPQSD